MSYQATQWARDQRTGSPIAKAILMVLAEQASVETGGCILSATTIGERAESKRVATLKYLAVLEDLVLISRERRFNPQTGHRMSDEIRLNLPAELVRLSPRDEPREAPKVRNTDLGGIPPKSISEGAKVRLRGVLGPPDGPHIDKGLEEGLGEGAREKRAKPKTSIPEGFPDAEAIERARVFLKAKGWNIDAGLEAEKFRSHNLANGGRWIDWRAAFHSWTVKAIGFAPASAKVAPIPQPGAEAPTDWRRRVAAFADPLNKHWKTTDWGPAPGKPGCNAPAAILAEFGFGPDNVVPINRSDAA